VVESPASYVDRILRGAKPAELPTQAPIKFEMVLNVGTAKALGPVVPANLLRLVPTVRPGSVESGMSLTS
jgi:putative ABC transport system substrate-binding protein